jgi:hypothetical protein
MVADELRRQADAFLELDDLKAAIGRHWKRSRRATIEFRGVIVGSKSGTTRPDAGWPHVKYFHRSKIVFRSTTPVVFAYPHRTGAGEFISNQFSPGRPRALLAAIFIPAARPTRGTGTNNRYGAQVPCIALRFLRRRARLAATQFN